MSYIPYSSVNYNKNLWILREKVSQDVTFVIAYSTYRIEKACISLNNQLFNIFRQPLGQSTQLVIHK